MATWHQQRTQQVLWHRSQYTVVTDPPGGAMSVMRFNTQAEAATYMENLARNSASKGKDSYILPPLADAGRPKPPHPHHET